MNIKFHTKALFTSIPITWYIMSSFQIRNNKACQKASQNSEKRQNKHKNQTQLWHRFWNYQTGNLTMLSKGSTRKKMTMQEEMGNICKEMGTLYWKGILEWKDRSRFIKRLDMAEERINELENMSTDLGATYVSKMWALFCKKKKKVNRNLPK